MVLPQVIRGRHEIANIGREIGIGELSFTAANAGKVEAQHGNVAGRETLRNPCGGEDVFAAGVKQWANRAKARGLAGKSRRAVKLPPTYRLRNDWDYCS